jgi:predicted thioredoxin/glutaredoxin
LNGAQLCLFTHLELTSGYFSFVQSRIEANAKEAVANLNLTAEVLHITDPIEIAKRGVMSTPAMTINGKVVSKGLVISPEQIQPLLQR